MTEEVADRVYDEFVRLTHLERRYLGLSKLYRELKENVVLNGEHVNSDTIAYMESTRRSLLTAASLLILMRAQVSAGLDDRCQESDDIHPDIARA